MYKVIATDYTEHQTIRAFETATEARNWILELEDAKRVAFAEILEVEKLTRQRLNERAQLEEECERLGVS